MLNTNAFEDRESLCDALDLDHYDPDRECPFGEVDLPEVLIDDPWFAEADAALDREADVDPGILDHLTALTPDASLVARLAGVDRAAMSPEDAVSFTVITERAIAWLSSVQDEAILAAGSGHTQVQELLVLDPRPDRHGERRIRIEDAIREEIAAATRWSLPRTHDRLVQARLLDAGLPRARAAQAEGRITPAHVQVLVQHAKRLPYAAEVLAGEATEPERAAFTEACEAFEKRVLRAAEGGTVGQAKAAARRAVLAIDGEGEARRRQQVKAIRDAFVWTEDDGLSVFAVRMATERAHACLAAVDALAHDDRFPSDCDATIGERRAEAAAALMLAMPMDGIPEPRLGAHLNLTIDLATLLDLRTALADSVGGGEGDPNVAESNKRTDDGMVEIAGVGAMPVDVVRGLLADPDVAITMRRLLTEPETGHLLDYGRRTYQVPDRLREFLTARDQTCRFPGCPRKASRCQVDHAEAWDDGGETTPANLGALCVRHHLLKTHSGWSITNSHPDGSCTWTSPHGREYTREPRLVGARAKREAEDIERIKVKHGITPHASSDASDVPPF